MATASSEGMTNFLAGLTPVQSRILRALVVLIAFSSAFDLIWQRLFDVESWYEYQGTEGPFLVTEENGVQKIGNTVINLVKHNSVVMIHTNICFKYGKKEQFFRTITRVTDGEVVSTAERDLENPAAGGCTKISNTFKVQPNWQPGEYLIHRALLLSSNVVGRFSNYLPVIRIEVKD